MKVALFLLVLLCVCAEFTEGLWRHECHCHKKRKIVEDLIDENIDSNGDGDIDRREAAAIFNVNESEPGLDVLLKNTNQKREDFLDAARSVASLMDSLSQ